MKPVFYSIAIVTAFSLSSLLAAPSCAETFEEALALAYQHNPELQAQRAKLRATDEQVSQALSGWRPDVEATAEAGKARQNVSGNALLINSGNVTPRDVNLNVGVDATTFVATFRAAQAMLGNDRPPPKIIDAR